MIQSQSPPAMNIVTATNHQHRHFKMYKPAKVLTQFKFTHRKRRNRTLLGDVIAADALLPSCDGVMAIGRLDEASEGLLLLTTDGKVSEQVRSKSVDKEYYVQLHGQITQEAIERLQTGVQISLPANNNKQRDDNVDDERACESSSKMSTASNTYTTLPCKARILDTVVVQVENKKRDEPEEQKPKRKKRKFGGTCNRCKQTGHKAKDCIENPVDYLLPNTKNDCNDDGLVQLALPDGIPPPSNTSSSHHSRPTTSWISITINEGKNRQVRRMTAAVGFPTLRLVRVRIGCVLLDGMVAGEVRELNDDYIMIDSITKT